MKRHTIFRFLICIFLLNVMASAMTFIHIDRQQRPQPIKHIPSVIMYVHLLNEFITERQDLIHQQLFRIIEKNNLQKIDEQQKQQAKETKTVTQPVPEVVNNIISKTYYYEQLSEQQKTIYTTLYTNFLNHNRSFEIQIANVDNLKPVYDALLFDHPEIFWVDYLYTYTPTLNSENVNIQPIYSYTEPECERIQKEIDSQVNAFLSTINSTMTEYDKILTTYRYVMDLVEYDINQEQLNYDQNLDSVFIKHQTVCTGYAKTIKYILNKMDINAIVIQGTATTDTSSEPHAWNIIQCENKFCQLDATWDDAVISFSQNIEEDGIIIDDGIEIESEKELNWQDYSYFMCSDDMISVNHTPDISYFTYPVCDTMNYYYYKITGSYFDTFNEQDIYQHIENTIISNENTTVIKAANPEIFNNISYRLENFMDYGNQYITTNYWTDSTCNSVTIPSLNEIVLTWTY